MEDNQGFTVERDQDGVIVVHGDIDVAGGPILEATLLDDGNTDTQVVIDLGDVPFIDSSGLRCLLGASRRAQNRGMTVVLRHLRNEALRLLEITGATDQFSIEDGRA
jgi:anti-anti-sigma factor